MSAKLSAETKVRVRRQWNDWQIIDVPLAALRDFHWRDTSGGVMARSPRPFLHARMWCTEIRDREFPHSCTHGRPPHEILVCIVKKDNPKAVVAELERQAEER